MSSTQSGLTSLTNNMASTLVSIVAGLPQIVNNLTSSVTGLLTNVLDVDNGSVGGGMSAASEQLSGLTSVLHDTCNI